MRELPLNGRDWTSLATLEPGVISIPNQVGTGFSANKGNRGFGNQLSDSGHRANENTYRVNGISINDYSNAAPGGASRASILASMAFRNFPFSPATTPRNTAVPPAQSSTRLPRAAPTISTARVSSSIATKFSTPRTTLIRLAPFLPSGASSSEGPAARHSSKTRPSFMELTKAFARTSPVHRQSTCRPMQSAPLPFLL